MYNVAHAHACMHAWVVGGEQILHVNELHRRSYFFSFLFYA